MPTRRWSRAIVGPVWPRTDPAQCDAGAVAAREKAAELRGCAASVVQTASGLAQQLSGAAIDGWREACYRTASRYTAWADGAWAGAASACDETALILSGLREDLDALDAAAHDRIDAVEAAMRSGVLPAAVGGPQIMQIVAQSAAAAVVLSTAAEGALAAQLGHLRGAIAQSPAAEPAGGEGPAVVDPALLAMRGLGGGRGPGGMPLSRIPGGGTPQDRVPGGQGQTPAPGDVVGASDGSAHPDKDRATGGVPSAKDPAVSGGDPSSDPQTNTADPNKVPGGSALSAAPDDSGRPESLHSGVSAGSGAVPAAPMPGGVPATSAAGGGAGAPLSALASGSGSSSAAAPRPSGLTGMRMPATAGAPPAVGSVSTAGGGAAVGSVPSTGAVPGASSGDFARGVGAGLGAGGAPAPGVPPVTPRPAPGAASGMPVAAPPASVPPPPAVPAPAAGVSPAGVGGSPTSGSGGAGLAMPGPMGISGLGAAGAAGAAGPLPPFGSDIRAASGPVVTPASSSAPGAPTVSASGGASSGAAALSVPGAVMSTAAGGAAGAVVGEAARTRDPLLVAAEQLVERLLHDSRLYPYMDWCVGVFRTRSTPVIYVVNGEGASFLPRGAVLPAGVRLLVAEPDLPPEFRPRWWGNANPVDALLAYAELVRGWGTGELWAVASSTGLGGSVVPARARGVTHLAEVCRTPSAADGASRADAGDAPHRLAAVDPALCAQLSMVSDPSQAWRTTVAAAQRALSRADETPGVRTPPVLGEVLNLLGAGMPVPADRWAAVNQEATSAAIEASSVRPGWVVAAGGDDALRYHALHDLARLAEMLLEWQPGRPDGREIAYLAHQIDAGMG